MGPHLDTLLAGFDFPLDPFQQQAAAAITNGRSVLVSAPTGAGKTVVADLAVADALDRGLRAFYTTPIKALSNQKFSDLRRAHGAGTVGLLTGDNSIDGDAPVVVMTTEVLRNMIYAGKPLDDLGVVVLDEVHYLQDSFRGPVWEEVIIHLPEHVQLVCLSATVSNVRDIGDWLETVRGPTDVVVEEKRPVTLDHLYLVGDKSGERLHLVPTLVGDRPNPEAEKFDVDRSDRAPRNRRGQPRKRWFTPSRLDVIDVLEDADLLPAIVFVFSRNGCDDAVRAAIGARVQLTTPDETARISQIIDAHIGSLTPADLDVLGFAQWRTGLEAGVAAHHAGHVPPFKEAVEACFVEGLVKVVFATETLALGINMPAKAVVIEKMTKFNGEGRVFLTPAEYTQLTGRAGRRGIDDHGTAIALWSPFIEFGRIAGLAGSKSFVLRSAFRPTYNMAANLVRRHERDAATRLLNQSLAQYQADRAVVVFERRRTERAQALEKAEQNVHCEFGDVREFAESLDESRRSVPRGAALDDMLARLRPGDVIATADEPRVAVLSTAFRKGGHIKIQAITPARTVLQLDATDFDEAPRVLSTVEVPPGFRPNDRDDRRELAARLSRSRSKTKKRPRQKYAAVDHPVAACPEVDSHLRALDRSRRLARELADIDRSMGQRTGTIARQFRDVCDLLDAWGHLDGWSLTSRGELLTGIYHESDLLVAEAITAGLFDGLDAPELAAVASLFVYEHRSPAPAPRTVWPSSRVRQRADRIDLMAEKLQRAEEQRQLPLTRRPDPGFAHLAHEWCAGAGLGALLDDSEVELTGGDFVRTVRQLADLVRQIGQHAPVAETRRTARRAADRIARGIVSASSLDDDVGATDADDADSS